MTGWRHRSWQALVLAGGVYAATVVQGAAPTYEEGLRPFVERADGTSASLDGLRIDVVGVDGAKVLGAGRILRPTEGVWLLVRLRLEATTEPVAVGAAWLVDGRGRRFSAASSGRFMQPMLDAPAQPGIPVEGNVAIELPAELATDVRLQVTRFGDYQLGEVVEFPLEVSAADVERWTAEGTELRLGEREVVP